jgi:TRAP-type C4-dicarboxylate transport system substrate-binding protein
MTGHFHGIALVLGNARSLARWPAEIRSHLRAALAEGTAAQWMLASQDETAARTALVAAGVDIIDLDQAARMAFERAVAEVADQAFSMLPPALPRLLGRLPTLERE